MTALAPTRVLEQEERPSLACRDVARDRPGGGSFPSSALAPPDRGETDRNVSGRAATRSAVSLSEGGRAGSGSTAFRLTRPEKRGTTRDGTFQPADEALEILNWQASVGQQVG